MGTAGSTPVSLLSPTATSSALVTLTPDNATVLASVLTGIGEKLAPAGLELIPDGAGGWRIVKQDPFGKLDTVGQVVDIVKFAAELGVSIGNGTATQASIWSATGKEAGCAVLDYGTYGLGCPVFTASYSAGNALFAPGKPLNGVIQGGTVDGVYVPGLGDFTKDVILDPASAAGNWVSNAWSSLW